MIGGGPAGLMAAEVLSAGGVTVDLYDSMPTLGRKFLMAGKGGLNITHSEPRDVFVSRYGRHRPQLENFILDFSPEDLRAWVHGLGIATFIGTSGRVFPNEMKAAPLLRAWIRRLREAGVRMHMRHRWIGWDEQGGLRFVGPNGPATVQSDAVVLALGGGSWSRLGSDGAWVDILAGQGVAIAPLLPSNCGFDVPWSAYFQEHFAGQAVKPVLATYAGADGRPVTRQGEFIITRSGVEGGLIYTFSSAARDDISTQGKAVVHLDLAPTRDAKRLLQDLSRPRGKNSLANYLRKCAGIEGVKAALLREVLPLADFDKPAKLASAIKNLPLTLVAPRPLDEVISTAGGVSFEELDGHLMLRGRPGVFCAGEMLNWEAPTGGYLLTACFATGRAAGQGVLAWLQNDK